ncbi:hypothetical protein LTR10_000483 [Elasticomyces elasticus]|nr:hypothetical protein LTR10_000483 [Elasticomyces elasticus]KAK4980268.1 hypothetical protein LTR42_000575 [Elasticomyces elasticus]
MASNSAAANTVAAQRMDNKEEVNDTRCRLLELPQELQDSIFELAVVHKAIIRIIQPFCKHYLDRFHLDGTWQDFSAHHRHARMQPELAKTCRSIRNSVLAIYYKQNTFEICCCNGDYWIPNMYGVRNWLSVIGGSNRALLKDLKAHGPISGRYKDAFGPVQMTVELAEAMSRHFAAGVLVAEEQTMPSSTVYRFQLTFAR